MTKKQARQKTRKLINDAAKLMREKLEKALYCGAINLENYDDDFELPKIIVHALLKDAAFRYEPFIKDNRKAAENLYKFI